MNLGREGIVIAVGAVVALLLQIVVAPNIALFSAQPNFLLAYVLVVAIARPLDAGSALPCTLYDCVVGLVLYPIIARLLASGAQDRGPRTPRLR